MLKSTIITHKYYKSLKLSTFWDSFRLFAALFIFELSKNYFQSVLSDFSASNKNNKFIRKSAVREVFLR